MHRSIQIFFVLKILFCCSQNNKRHTFRLVLMVIMFSWSSCSHDHHVLMVIMFSWSSCSHGHHVLMVTMFSWSSCLSQYLISRMTKKFKIIWSHFHSSNIFFRLWSFHSFFSYYLHLLRMRIWQQSSRFG